MLFLNDAEIVIAQTEIEGEAPREAVAILQVKGVGILESIAIRAAGPLSAAGGSSGQEFLQRGRYQVALRIRHI